MTSACGPYNLGGSTTVPHHASEAVGVLLDLLGSLKNVVELFHFCIHHALGHVVLAEGFGKLHP